MPTASLALDYNLAKWAKIKLSYLDIIHMGGTSSESGSGNGGFLFDGLNFRF